MDLQDFASTLLRRWYLTLSVLVVALSGGVALAQIIGPTYTASSSAVLIPPESRLTNAVKTPDSAPTNPLMYLGGLGQSRDLLIATMRGQRVSEAVEVQFPGLSYELVPDATSSAPILIVTVKTASADQATKALDQLMTTATTELVKIQTSLDIVSENQIGSFRLATDVSPTVQRKTQVQLAVVGAAGIALLGLLLLGLVDHLLRSRHRPRGGAHRRSASQDAGGPQEGEVRIVEQRPAKPERVDRDVFSRSGGPPSTGS